MNTFAVNLAAFSHSAKEQKCFGYYTNQKVKKTNLKSKFKCCSLISKKSKFLSCAYKKTIKVLTIGCQCNKESFAAALRLYCKLVSAKLLNHFKYCRDSILCLLKISDKTVESESLLGW